MNLKKKLNDTLSFMSEHDRVLFLYNNILLKNPDDNFDLNRETFNMLFSSDSENSDIFDNMSGDATEADDFFTFLDENEESFDAFSYSDEELDGFLDGMDDELDYIESEDDVQVEVLVHGNILVLFSNSEDDINSYIYNYCFLEGYIFTKIADSEVKNIKSFDVVTGYKHKTVLKVHGKLENDICYN